MAMQKIRMMIFNQPNRVINSPGAGRAFEQISNPNGNERKFVIAGAKDDHRPTTPGHSPGAGHQLGNN